MTVGGQSVAVIHCDESAYSTFRCKCGGDHGTYVAWGMIVEHGGERGGFYLSMTANQARQHAAILTDLANEIDGGKGKQ